MSASAIAAHRLSSSALSPAGKPAPLRQLVAAGLPAGRGHAALRVQRLDPRINISSAQVARYFPAGAVRRSVEATVAAKEPAPFLDGLRPHTCHVHRRSRESGQISSAGASITGPPPAACCLLW